MSRREAQARRAATRAASLTSSHAAAPAPTRQEPHDDAWLALHGTPAQRRSAVRRLRAAARRGDPAARELLKGIEP